MPTELSDDPLAFRAFMDSKLSNGGETLGLGELLALWEYENTPPEEIESTIQSIQRGLEDMYAGRTSDAFEFVERMRKIIQTKSGQ